MRFSCKSSTSEAFIAAGSSGHNTSKAGGSSGVARAPKRMSAKARSSKLNSAKNAVKKIEKLAKGAEFAYIYVGNIDSSVTEERLKAFFSDCGAEVTRVLIRCSMGRVGVAVPKDVRSQRDVQYASVEFKGVNGYRAARKAILKNGAELDGCKLLISASPANMPEALDAMERNAMRLQERKEKPYPRAAPAKRPLVAHDTEVITPTGDNHKLFGISFGKCIF